MRCNCILVGISCKVPRSECERWLHVIQRYQLNALFLFCYIHIFSRKVTRAWSIECLGEHVSDGTNARRRYDVIALSEREKNIQMNRLLHWTCIFFSHFYSRIECVMLLCVSLLYGVVLYVSMWEHIWHFIFTFLFPGPNTWEHQFSIKTPKNCSFRFDLLSHQSSPHNESGE